MVSYAIDVRTVTPHFPGIGRYVRSLAHHIPSLLQDDERLVLIGQPSVRLPGDVDDRSGPVRTAATTASPFSLQQQWAVPRLLRRQAKDDSGLLYHSSYYLMPYTVNYPTVLTVHDTIALTRPSTVSARARTLFRVTTKLALLTSDQIIANSNTTRRDLLAHFAVDPASVETIYLGVDDRFGPQPHDEQESVRARYQLPREFLLYFGSNKPHKNLVRLIDAYAILHAAWCEERDSIPPLVIAGAWDATHPEAKIRAKNLGLDAQVRFLGPIADFELPALYSAATAFLFPSQYEGFGLPVLEAMACGTPVACSHTSSLPEVAGEAALYFEPDDKESIAQAMLALLSDPPLRAKLSDLGRRRAASFSWRTTARKTIELYRSLLQRRRAKGNR